MATQVTRNEGDNIDSYIQNISIDVDMQANPPFIRPNATLFVTYLKSRQYQAEKYLQVALQKYILDIKTVLNGDGIWCYSFITIKRATSRFENALIALNKLDFVKYEGPNKYVFARDDYLFGDKGFSTDDVLYLISAYDQGDEWDQWDHQAFERIERLRCISAAAARVGLIHLICRHWRNCHLPNLIKIRWYKLAYEITSGLSHKCDRKFNIKNTMQLENGKYHRYWPVCLHQFFCIKNNASHLLEHWQHFDQLHQFKCKSMKQFIQCINTWEKILLDSRVIS